MAQRKRQRQQRADPDGDTGDVQEYGRSCQPLRMRGARVSGAGERPADRHDRHDCERPKNRDLFHPQADQPDQQRSPCEEHGGGVAPAEAGPPYERLP